MISGVISRRWFYSSWLLSLVLIAPVLVLLFESIGAGLDTFSHLWQTVLPDYIYNTLLLGAGVVILAGMLGITSAAFVALTDLPTQNILRWLLLLPLAMPAYLVAYIYTDLFDYAGPIQRFLRHSFNWHSPADYWFFDIRTLPGAIVIIALVLYPYVYMLARGAFEQQDRNLIRAGRLLGLSPIRALIKLSLPLARPAIAVALGLVLMETLADFATVQYFAVNTLTTAVYDTWLGYGDLGAANAIASVLLLFIFIVVVWEQRSRSQLRHQTSRAALAPDLVKLSFSGKFFGLLFCWLLVICGFLLPLILLLIMMVQYSSWASVAALMPSALNSIYVASIVASLSVIIALHLGLFKRLHASKNRHWPQRISGLGYALPGTVLAMAILATFGPIDHSLNNVFSWLGLHKPGLIFSGTVVAIIFAYLVRFSAIANGSVDSGLSQVAASLDKVPATLGATTKTMIRRVHLPLLKRFAIVAWLLVFVESMKELPAVLLLRPFNFETLATSIYQLISDERLEQGAIGAVLIVIFGLIPIIWLNKQKDITS